MTKVEEHFCEELQELLDRYKTQLEVPTIMRNAQKLFYNTLSIKHHPELYPQEYIENNLKKYFTDEKEGVWKEPEKRTIPCKWEFEIAPVEDVTGEADE